MKLIVFLSNKRVQSLSVVLSVNSNASYD